MTNTTTTTTTTTTSSNHHNTANISINNHAVIVSSSRYWFNYRHAVNALSIYQLIKSQGIPDSNIVLMIADDYASNTRNPYKNGMYAHGTDKPSLYTFDIEIDYRGEDVTVETLTRVLLGRGPPGQPQLHTDSNSNIVLYLTGHGGDQFFKFQDIEEIDASEMARLVDELYRRQKYRSVLIVADTCQAFTLGDAITAPNVLVVGSSLRGESSYAHHSDAQLGLSVIERYTHQLIQFIQQQVQPPAPPKQTKKQKGIQQQPQLQLPQGNTSMKHPLQNLTIPQAMVDPYPFYQQRAHIGFRHTDLLLPGQSVDSIMFSDFFVNNQLLLPDSSDGGDAATSTTGKITLATTSTSPITLPKGWPFMSISADISTMATYGTTAEHYYTTSIRRLLQSTRTTTAPPLLGPLTKHSMEIPVVDDPSDGRFLSVVAIMLAMLLVLSSKRT